MAIRCLLHKSKLEEFKSWMDSQGLSGGILEGFSR